MQTITRLQVQKNNQERVNVFLDDEYAFAVSLDRAVSLQKGQTLSPDEVATLKAEGDADLAYQRSLRLLARRPRSSQEIIDYLVKRGHDAQTVDQVVARLVQRKYLDDDAFAAYWIDQRNRFRPRGAMALRHELRQKGLAREIIEEAIEVQDEDETALAALLPKIARWLELSQEEFNQKALAHLARRGFAYAVARRAAEQAWADATEQEDDIGQEDDNLEK